MFRKIIGSSLFKSALIYIICSALNKAVPFLILPVLSYYLLPEAYGIVSNYSVFLAILVIFIGISVDGAISVQYYSLSAERLRVYIFNCLLLTLISTVIFTGVIFLFNSAIYDWFRIPLKYQYLGLGVALSTVITTINLTLWRLEEQPLKYGVYEISQTIFNLLISLYFVVHLLLGWEGRLDGILIATISFGLFSSYFLVKRSYIKIQISRGFLRSILLFGIPLIPHALSIWIRAGVDRILITKFINEAATGLYATGFQFGIFVSFITMAFNNAFVPFLFKKLNEKDPVQLSLNKINLVKITYICVFGFALLGIFFALTSQFLLKYAFSEKYLAANKYIIWAIVAQTFQGFYLLFVNYLFFIKKTKILASLTISCSVLQIVLSYVLIPKYGAIGAAYSTVIVSFINFILILIASCKLYRMPWFYWLEENSNGS